MITIQKIIMPALIVAASFGSFQSRVNASSDPFYQSLAKTQEQKYTEASGDLTKLGHRLKKRGDTSNAYRSLATAEYIRYERDSLLTYKRKGSRDPAPRWMGAGACWSGGPGSDAVTGKAKCNFRVSWASPPVATKNFGGLIVLENSLVSDSYGSGLLDTVVFPKLKRNEEISLLCEIVDGEKKGQGAVAIATYDPKLERYTKVRQSWYTDFQTNRIRAINPQQVKCKAIQET
jgi:hypothetical protein